MDSTIQISYHVDSDSASSVYPLIVQFYKSDSLGNGEIFLRTDTFKIADFNNGGKIVDFEFSTNLQNGDSIVSTATDNDGNTSEFSTKINIGPIIELNVTSFDFGEVIIEESRDMVITISNPGNGNLIITDISSDNSLFTANKDSMTIALGGSVDLMVTFSPDSVKEETGKLTIQSNLEDIEISLSGSGVEPLGLEELLSEQITLYSNPTNRRFEILIYNGQIGEINIRVIDQLGRVFISENVYKAGEELRHSIDLSGKAPGIYFVQIQTNKAQAVKRIIKY